MLEPTYIPEQWNDRTMLQVRDGEIMLFRKPPDQETKTPEQLEKQRQLMLEAKKGNEVFKGQYSGTMTPGARKRMTKAVTLLCQATKPKWITNPVNGRMQYHRLSFCTLTVSSRKNMTAKDCYQKLVQHFIQWLRRTKKITSYVWKAELQQRGQIHYHFIFPEFIHYREIRNVWNRLQREAGLLDEFAAKHKHADPNSTDIHEMINVRKTAKYVVKELGKDIDAKKLQMQEQLNEWKRTGEITHLEWIELSSQLKQDKFYTEGKIWDCSDNISGMGYFTMPLTVRQDMLIRKWIEQEKEQALFGDWWAVVDLTGHSPPEVLNTAEKKLFHNHIDIIRQGGKKYLKELTAFLN